jgi:molybdopterin molybdotransferase
MDLTTAAGYVAAERLTAQVDSPSVNAAAKDGFAVISADLAGATESRPVRLTRLGSVFAGETSSLRVSAGHCVQVTTGAPLPAGAEAVLPDEFVREEGEIVICLAEAGPGRNVLPRGHDVRQGQVVAEPGEALSPGRLGLAAAGGCRSVMVHPRPRAALLACGTEVVAPGRPLPPGGVYASNLVTQIAWLDRCRIEVMTGVVEDDPELLRAAIDDMLSGADALLTSGGAWLSQRDLVRGVLRDLGWQEAFHRVRLGPGKGVGYGKLKGKPVFVLPGGPPSNETALLLLALPGLWRLAGFSQPVFPRLRARLAEPVQGQPRWTKVIRGRLEHGPEGPVFHPLTKAGRLTGLALAQGLLVLAEDTPELPIGHQVDVLDLR